MATYNLAIIFIYYFTINERSFRSRLFRHSFSRWCFWSLNLCSLWHRWKIFSSLCILCKIEVTLVAFLINALQSSCHKERTLEIHHSLSLVYLYCYTNFPETFSLLFRKFEILFLCPGMIEGIHSIAFLNSRTNHLLLCTWLSFFSLSVFFFHFISLSLSFNCLEQDFSFRVLCSEEVILVIRTSFAFPLAL